MRAAFRLGVLRIVLGGMPVVLAMASDECNGGKIGGPAGVVISGATFNLNVNAAASSAAQGAAEGMDRSAGEKGRTEYDFDTSKCRFVTDSDGKRVNTVCE